MPPEKRRISVTLGGGISTSRNASTGSPSPSRLPLVILLVCLAGSILLFLAVGIGSVAYPYDLNYGEAQIADQARRAFAGEPQYKSDLSVPP
jgi:hypothetical protein